MHRILPVFLAALLSLPAAAAPEQLHLSVPPDPAGGIVITWLSDRPEGAVEYGEGPDYGRRAGSAARTHEGRWIHHVRLEGLAPGTRWHYRCGTDGDWSADRTFATAPAPGTPFRFVAWGDSRSGEAARRRVRAAVRARAPALSIFTGDLVDDGRVESQWDAWFESMEPLLSVSPLMPVAGNHERGAASFWARFVLPEHPEPAGWPPEAYYSFDYAGVHFVALSTEPVGGADGAQTRWLEADLAAAAADPGIRWIVAFAHRPPYSTGSHGPDREVRRVWVPLFERYGVDLAFFGHEHQYERFVPLRGGRAHPEGVTYVVTGGAGAPLRGVSPGELTAHAAGVHHYVEVQVEAERMVLEARDPACVVLDRAEVRDVPPLDSADPAAGLLDPEPVGGCGCRGTTAAAGALPATLLLGAVVAARRRRRRRADGVGRRS